MFEIPRLDCLGLIEAAAHVCVPLSSAGRIPRLDCLGLIEASVVDSGEE